MTPVSRIVKDDLKVHIASVNELAYHINVFNRLPLLTEIVSEDKEVYQIHNPIFVDVPRDGLDSWRE